MIAAGEHRNPKNFGLVNPNLNYSVDREFLEREMTKAESAGEESVRGFLAKHLNVEIGLALRSDRWSGADFWERQGTAGLTLAEVIQRSDVLAVGIDGGGLDDLLGIAVVGRDSRTRDWLHWGHAWAHPSVLERRKSEAGRFKDFAAQGDLTLVDDMPQDVNEVAGIVFQVWSSGKLDKIGCDPVGIGAIVDAIVELGIEQELIVGISQGWRLAGAIKTAERKLAEGGLHHGGSPLMAWCVSNARVEPRANSTLITKQASGTAKIDPLMALFNAVELMSRNPGGNVIDSSYELVLI
jgi:phage terminase large subunit-like protein